jgi:hypothetical protein
VPAFNHIESLGTGSLNITDVDIIFSNLIIFPSKLILGCTSHTFQQIFISNGLLFWNSGTILGLGSITITSVGVFTIINPSSI